MKKLLCTLGGMWWGGILLFAQNAHQSLRAGDRDYLRENYSVAQKHYQDAIRQNPGSLQATYNLGCAEYRQGHYPEAEKAFQQAVTGAQLPATKADALYNLGNARLKQQKFGEAIEAYESSLRLRPGDAATKQNLQMAKHKLQAEQKSQQKPQQNQNGQPPSEDQKQPPQDQPKPPQQQPDPGEGQPQNSEEQPGQEGRQPAPPTATGQMTREEAQRTLETTIGPEDRKNARKYRAAGQQKKEVKTKKKDW